MNITSNSPNLTTYSGAIGGTGAHSETIWVSPTVGLSQFGYGTNGMNELQSIASGGTAYIKGTTDRPVKPVTLNSSPAIAARMIHSKSFVGQPSMAAGANAETVNATNGANTTTSTSYQLNVQGPSSATLTYDKNGNMTSDGTNTYSWDAEDRLIQVTYPGSGNNTQFVYDSLSRCVKIVEAGTTPSIMGNTTKQFVWCGSIRCEERDAMGDLTSSGKQFFDKGQANFSGGASLKYFYNMDHLGSIREMTKTMSGITTIQAQYGYDPYGQVTKLAGSEDADFQYAGYYINARSGLNLTRTRTYSPALGRWINRDTIGIAGGLNLYGYVFNVPVANIDPLGLSGYLSIVTGMGTGGSSTREGLTGRHAWLEYQQDGGEQTSWGTFKGYGLAKNYELENPDRYSPTARRQKYVDDDAEARLSFLVEEYERMGEDAWGWLHPCTSFAEEVWKILFGEDLAGYTPRGLEGSIRDANNADLKKLIPIRGQ